jgi:type VI secretion system secreted protein Hcp
MFDAYLKIDGVPGESSMTGFEDQIEVLSYSHGIVQPSAGSRSSAGGGTTGRCEHHDFTIVKEVDKATPLICGKCSDGKHIDNVVLTLCRAGGTTPVAFMEIKMTDVVISSVQPSGSKEGLPIESVAFNYGKIEWVYTQQKRKGGEGGGKTTASYDLTKGRGA